MTVSGYNLSEYGAMWIFAMHDLPVDDKPARDEYTKFRKKILAQGFSMLQYSVYAKHCVSEEAADTYKKRIRNVLPPDGQVRLLSVTDRQFGKMEVYYGKSREAVEDPPMQMMLF